MRETRITTISLLVTVVVLGTVLGGAAYANLVYFPAFLADLPTSSAVVLGTYGLDEGAFWVPAHLTLILSLGVCFWLNRGNPAIRNLILMTVGVYAGLLVWNVLYFYRELYAFGNSPSLTSVTSAEWSERASRWRVLSWARVTIMYAGSVPLLIALVRSTEPEPDGAPTGPTVA